MYKKRGIFVAIAVLFIAVFVTSCAQQTYDPSETFPQESFEAWVKKYDPEAQKMPSGIFMRFVERDPLWSEMPQPVINENWLSINYTGRSFDRNIFESRDSVLAKMAGFWNITTHFVNDYVYYSKTQVLCDGLVDALSYMREGDSVRVYIPAALAYSSTMSVNAGYSVSGASYVNFPVYFDFGLSQIVKDPYQKELSDLKSKAVELGFDLVKDSIDKGLFVRIIDAKPLGDTITKDSTVKVWHANYFFDGQLVTTNVDSIAREAGYYKSDESYKARELSPANFDGQSGTYLVYPKAVLKMRKGEKAEVLAASWWGAGMQGDLAAKPQILPYQSLRYIIDVIDPSAEQDEDEKE